MPEAGKKRWLPVLWTVLTSGLIGYTFLIQWLELTRVMVGSIDHYIWDYLDNLLAAAAGVLGLYLLYRGLGRFPRVRRRVAAAAAAVLVVWSLITACRSLERWDTDLTESFRTADNGWESVDRREILWQLLGKSRFIGPAEDIYQYPEPETLTSRQGDLLRDALDERERIETALGRWETDFLLAELSLTYGWWVLLVYLGLVLGWTACVILFWRQLHRKHWLFYGTCVLLLLVRLWAPALNGLGLVLYPCDVTYGFTWQEGFPGGMLQLALTGLLLWRPESVPSVTGRECFRRLLLCDRILMGEDLPDPEETVLSEPAGNSGELPPTEENTLETSDNSALIS